MPVSRRIEVTQTFLSVRRGPADVPRDMRCIHVALHPFSGMGVYSRMRPRLFMVEDEVLSRNDAVEPANHADGRGLYEGRIAIRNKFSHLRLSAFDRNSNFVFNALIRVDLGYPWSIASELIRLRWND
jgi:hypothetical protein